MSKLKSAIAVMLVATMLVAGCAKREEVANKEGVNATTESKGKKESTEVKEMGVDFNKTGLPLVNEQATFKVVGVGEPRDLPPNELVLVKDLEELTNVHIEFEIYNVDAWKDKKGLLFASGDLPDIFLGDKLLTEEDLLTYGNQGLFIPLEDLIETYGEHLKSILHQHPEYKKTITAPDGHIYGLPSIDAGNPITTDYPLYMNTDWLKAVNMKVPTTTEEFYQVLKAFKVNDVNGNGDPQDEIPFSSQESNFYVSQLFGAFGIIDDYKTHISLENDKTIFTATDDRYKEAIIYFNRLNSEGLLDEELFTQDSKIFKGKTVHPDKRVIGAFQSWRSSQWKRKNEDQDYTALTPLKGPGGEQLWPERLVGVYSKSDAAITSACKNPELALRWLDQWYEPYFAIQQSYKLYEGVHIKRNDEGKYVNIKERKYEGEDLKYFPNKTRIFNMTPESGKLLAERPPHIVEKQNLDKIYNGYYPAQTLPKLFFTVEENKKLTELKADIIALTNEMYAKWIITGGIEKEWEEYKKQVEAMGLEEYIQIHQDAYNRFLNN